MEFSDIIAVFDINECLKVENYLLGQNGYLFHLNHSIGFLYEETKGENYAEFYLNGKSKVLLPEEVDKIHSLLRLQRIKPGKLKQKHLLIYSKHIERVIHQLIEEKPKLERGSTHTAFAPVNYTRFSENLIFDFNYLYSDKAIIEIILSFDKIYQTVILDNLPINLPNQEWSDDVLYRYLLDFIRKSRISINGKISTPGLIRALFQYSVDQEVTNLVFHFGPYLLFLKTEENIPELMPRKQNINITELEKNYMIIYPDIELIKDLLKSQLEV